MENELEKKEKVGQWLLLYGKLLTKNICHRMEMFYLEDYSITEISQLEKVSRNAVFESLSHGEKQLSKYESILKLDQKNERVSSLLEKIIETDDQEEKEKLVQAIKGELGYGI